MPDQKPNTDQRDSKLDAETRPYPSQAEGDLETVEEDLKDKAGPQEESLSLTAASPKQTATGRRGSTAPTPAGSPISLRPSVDRWWIAPVDDSPA